jgi:hypothetical protein
VIISIDVEKVSEKLEHPFWTKALRNLGIEGTFLHIIKPK